MGSQGLAGSGDRFLGSDPRRVREDPVTRDERERSRPSKDHPKR
jgi:hypothetical protein